LHVPQYLALTRRLVHRQPGGFLYVADLERARRAGVQQPHELLVKRVDPLAQLRQAV
jgi:hypothetical protein